MRGEDARMRPGFSGVVAAMMLVWLAGCGEDGMQGPQSGGTGGTVTGNERLGWDIQAADAAALSQIRYAIYIDTARRELTGVTCTPPSGASGFPCSAPLPQMTPGEHTLELASFVVSGSTILESPKSPPLRITVGSSVGSGSSRIPDAPPDDDGSSDRTLVTADGIRLRLQVSPRYFDQPTDVAVAPDGRMLVTERSGRVRVLEAAGAVPTIADVLQDVEFGTPRGGLLAVALSPAFADDSLVFLLYTVAGADGPSFRVTRYREVNGRLGERAVILDNIAASPAQPAGSLRFGRDGKMYVALDDGGDPMEAARAGSFNGKILRLNPDGSTPSDRGTTSPVYSSGHRSPRGFDWDPRTGALWLIDVRGDVESLTVADLGAQALRRDAPGSRPVGRPGEGVVRLPRQTAASGIAAYDDQLIEGMRGDLLLASAGFNNLLRLRIDPRTHGVAASERLLPEGIGSVRAVTVAPDGRIVVVGESLIILSPGGQ